MLFEDYIMQTFFIKFLLCFCLTKDMECYRHPLRRVRYIFEPVFAFPLLGVLTFALAFVALPVWSYEN